MTVTRIQSSRSSMSSSSFSLRNVFSRTRSSGGMGSPLDRRSNSFSGDKSRSDSTHPKESSIDDISATLYKKLVIPPNQNCSRQDTKKKSKKKKRHHSRSSKSKNPFDPSSEGKRSSREDGYFGGIEGSSQTQTVVTGSTTWSFLIRTRSSGSHKSDLASRTKRSVDGSTRVFRRKYIIRGESVIRTRFLNGLHEGGGSSTAMPTLGCMKVESVFFCFYELLISKLMESWINNTCLFSRHAAELSFHLCSHENVQLGSRFFFVSLMQSWSVSRTQRALGDLHHCGKIGHFPYDDQRLLPCFTNNLMPEKFFWCS